MSAPSRLFRALPVVLAGGAALGGATMTAHAQSARFTLRAEPDVIPANGISTTSIFVQVPQSRNAITATSVVRFATTAGVIENQASLSDGVARVLLRSSNTPGTAVVTAFIGNSREVITVEFSSEAVNVERYLELSAPYVAYGSGVGIITSSGKSQFEFGDIRIESDVRMDVDLYTERVWAQGNKGGVTIRQGRGDKAKTLRGDRLFFELQRRSGVMRRADGDASDGENGARQEFFGANFTALPPRETDAPDIPPAAPNAQMRDAKAPVADAPVAQAPAAVVPEAGQLLGNGVDSDAPQSLLDNRQMDTEAFSESGAVAAKKAENAVAENAATDDAADANLTAPAIVPGKDGESAASPDAAPTAPEAGAPANDAAATGSNEVGSNEVGSKEADVAAAEANASKSSQFMTASEHAAATPPLPVPGAPSGAVLPGAVAAPGTTQTQSNPLVSQPRPAGDVAGEPGKLPGVPAYGPLPDGGPDPRIVELPPPSFDVTNGYWVAARRLRVFPREQIQFERASIYYNGGKAFKQPLYVLPLDGTFNPTTDLFGFNTAGGVSVRFPVYYQASRSGTGALFLRNDPGSGFSANRSGPSLEIDQQYTLSPRSRGRINVDQIGNGPFNLNFAHQLDINPTTSASLFLNMPRHRDLFARAALSKNLRSMQVGLETFYDAPQGERGAVRGQMFARLRPKTIGRTGLTYTVSANLLAISRVPSQRTIPGTGLGGGIGIPGQGNGARIVTDYNSLLGQTLTASLQAPLYSPWSGAQFTGSLLTTAYNYSNGNRGVAPGLTLGYAQRLGKIAGLRLDYTYDRSAIGLYGATGNAFTNYVSASLDVQLSPKIGFSTFASKSLTDQSLYGNADLSFRISPKWRAGLFADYSSFAFDSSFNYGWSLARAVGPRELSINYDAVRSRIYLQIGNARL